MTKSEAQEKMKSGHKITHDYFGSNEWMKLDDDGFHYLFEDGVRVHPSQFWGIRSQSGWGDGWSLFNEQTK